MRRPISGAGMALLAGTYVRPKGRCSLVRALVMGCDVSGSSHPPRILIVIPRDSRPPHLPKPTIWDKVDRAVLAQVQASSTTGSEPPATRTPKKYPRVRRVLRDLVGSVVWLYIVGQLFVVDVDRKVVEKIIPGARHVLPYKFLFVLACFVGVAIYWRRLLLPALYVSFFPVVVLLWKVPKFLYKVRSGTLVLGLVNVITSAFTDFRYNVASTVAWIAGAAFALTVHSSYLQWPAIVLLAVPLVRSYWRTLRFSFRPSRFVTLQTKAIATAVSSDLATSLVELDPGLKSSKVKKFDKPQLDQFVQKVQTAIIANRFLYSWAYQLDQYRRGALPFLFSLASYIWLFLSTLFTLTLVNIAVLHISRAQFTGTVGPSVVIMLHYTLSSFVVGTITQIDAAKTGAQLLQILGGILGPTLLLTVLANFIFSRTAAQDESLQQAVDTIKTRGDDLRARFQVNFDVTIEDAITRLEEIGSAALLGVIAFLSKQFPEDFIT